MLPRSRAINGRSWSARRRTTFARSRRSGSERIDGRRGRICCPEGLRIATTPSMGHVRNGKLAGAMSFFLRTAGVLGVAAAMASGCGDEEGDGRGSRRDGDRGTSDAGPSGIGTPRDGGAGPSGVDCSRPTAALSDRELCVCGVGASQRAWARYGDCVPPLPNTADPETACSEAVLRNCQRETLEFFYETFVPFAECLEDGPRCSVSAGGLQPWFTGVFARCPDTITSIGPAPQDPGCTAEIEAPPGW